MIERVLLTVLIAATATPALADTSDPTAANWFFFLLFVGIMFWIYFLPTYIARKRHHNNTAAIFILNLFLGWSLVGWVIALVWALLNPPTATRAS